MNREDQIHAFIGEFSRLNGYPPTIREIGIELGITSTNGVRYWLSLLERQRRLMRRPGIARGLVAL